MALFGKKKEESPAPGMPPDMGMPADQGYGAQGYGQDPGQYPQEAYSPEQYPQGAPMPPQGPPPGPAPPLAPEADKEKIEEVAEAIVEEKWKDKKKEIDEVIEWKEEINTKIGQLKQEMDDLKASFESLHKGILGKITEYDTNLTNVGTEIKAMEKVFSKVLPSLTDSVNKLQRFSGKKK